MEMGRPGKTSRVFLKIVCPHHLSSLSLVGGRLPIKGPVAVISTIAQYDTLVFGVTLFCSVSLYTHRHTSKPFIGLFIQSRHTSGNATSHDPRSS